MNPNDADSPNIMLLPTLKLDDKSNRTRTKTTINTKCNSFLKKIIYKKKFISKKNSFIKNKIHLQKSYKRSEIGIFASY